jgi:hypothetical protein
VVKGAVCFCRVQLCPDTLSISVANPLFQIHDFHQEAYEVGTLAWYRNIYECPNCEKSWEDEWSCSCDDECPHCGERDCSPVDSDDLSVVVEIDPESTQWIYYSPADADHSPDYVLLARTSKNSLADFLKKLASELATPL